MNSSAIKLNGKFEIPEPLEIGKSYDLKISIGINNINKRDLENGDFEYTFNAKPEYGEVTKDNGKTLKMRKKGSQSQKLRADILNMGLEYEVVMSGIITFLPEVLELLSRKDLVD